jgi:hypothetical protein
MIGVRLLTFLAVVLISTSAADADDPSRELAKDMLVRAGTPRAEAEAQDAWLKCTEGAVVKFAPQSEPATIVATAAIAACIPEEIRYAQESVKDPTMRRVGATVGGMQEAIEKAAMPDLLARTMAIRASRQ